MSDSNAVINRFFAAMQSGASSEDQMMALFADDAVYVEPFTGTVRAHTGKEAIRNAMREGWKRPLPEMRIEVDEVNVAGDRLEVRWTCRSPSLPGGKGRGENIFDLRQGLITRLETRFLG